jgi:hypothetical protein
MLDGEIVLSWAPAIQSQPRGSSLASPVRPPACLRVVIEEKNKRPRMVKKLDLLDSDHGCAERAILGKHSKTEVTQRYTVHN